MPVFVMLLAVIGAPILSCARRGWSGRNLYVGFLQALPFVLVVSYCLVPSVSKTIFQSWSCTAYQFDGKDLKNIVYQSFLRKDLSVRCSEFGYSNSEHDAIKRNASVLLAIWPVGMVVMYAVILLFLRNSVRSRKLTPLMRATKFLHRGYKADWFAWELVDLNRRTVLIGWVIIIFDSDRSFLRLVTALLLSIASLTLLFSTYPYV